MIWLFSYQTPYKPSGLSALWLICGSRAHMEYDIIFLFCFVDQNKTTSHFYGVFRVVTLEKIDSPWQHGLMVSMFLLTEELLCT